MVRRSPPGRAARGLDQAWGVVQELAGVLDVDRHIIPLVGAGIALAGGDGWPFLVRSSA